MYVESASLRVYVARRVLQTIPLLLGVIVIAFALSHLAPGDPVYIFAGEAASEEYLNMLREHLGLNRPLYEQLVIYVITVIQGDLGRSFVHGQPVLKVIWDRLPATLLLTGAATLFSFALGIVLGVISSKRPYSIADNIITAICLSGYSIPVFWFAQTLIIILSVGMGWFPVQGMVTVREEMTGIGYVFDVAHHLFLPALTLTLVRLALTTRLTRASMLEVCGQDFITTAWSKGLDENTVFYRHVLRNALLPVTTVLGLEIGTMVAGAILTETVFGWPGLGRLMYDAIVTRDYPLLMGNFVVLSVSVVILNLITDISYGVLDPRIRRR